MTKEYENDMDLIIASAHLIIHSVGEYKWQLTLRPQKKIPWMERITVLWPMSTNPIFL
jgi:hypothetical protein